MSAQQNKTPKVEVMDNGNARWPLVLKMFDRLGQRKALDLDEDGWLPVRQRVLVAFVDEKPAAHLSFHIHPVNRKRLEAHLDAVGFAPAAAKEQLSRALRQAAMRHARTLRCTAFKGIDDLRGPHTQGSSQK